MDLNWWLYLVHAASKPTPTLMKHLQSLQMEPSVAEFLEGDFGFAGKATYIGIEPWFRHSRELSCWTGTLWSFGRWPLGANWRSRLTPTREVSCRRSSGCKMPWPAWWQAHPWEQPSNGSLQSLPDGSGMHTCWECLRNPAPVWPIRPVTIRPHRPQWSLSLWQANFETVELAVGMDVRTDWPKKRWANGFYMFLHVFTYINIYIY